MVLFIILSHNIYGRDKHVIAIHGTKFIPWYELPIVFSIINGPQACREIVLKCFFEIKQKRPETVQIEKHFIRDNSCMNIRG